MSLLLTGVGSEGSAVPAGAMIWSDLSVMHWSDNSIMIWM